MSTRDRFVGLAWLMLLPTTTVAAPPPQAAADGAAVTRLEQRWIADIAGGNRDDLATILADDYRDLDWQGHPRNKVALLAAIGKPRNSTQRITQLDVRVWGNAAVATGINQVQTRSTGRTVEIAFTDVFARIDGHWHAVSSQETVRRPTASAKKS
ncbi:MAG TPA: nuclear transport factor 2 family protein [Rhodanobacteraceae bacterium]|nr:nuclear transport factor 2 family protein [Rhodanobacteraceae bacterium]